MAVSADTLLALLALCFAGASMAPVTINHHLLGVAVLLLAIIELV